MQLTTFLNCVKILVKVRGIGQWDLTADATSMLYSIAAWEESMVRAEPFIRWSKFIVASVAENLEKVLTLHITSG